MHTQWKSPGSTLWLDYSARTFMIKVYSSAVNMKSFSYGVAITKSSLAAPSGIHLDSKILQIHLIMNAITSHVLKIVWI